MSPVRTVLSLSHPCAAAPGQQECAAVAARVHRNVEQVVHSRRQAVELVVCAVLAHDAPVETSDDPGRLDLGRVHRWLSQESYWARGLSRPAFEASVAASLCLGAYDGSGRQLGFARVVTDGATFGWLCDVFVAREARGQGVGKALVEAAVTHPSLTGVRRLMLATADAHALYAGFGFQPLDVALFMERRS